ncbi:MAG: helix-turn-helix domain-containing protein [Shimia sp.]
MDCISVVAEGFDDLAFAKCLELMVSLNGSVAHGGYAARAGHVQGRLGLSVAVADVDDAPSPDVVLLFVDSADAITRAPLAKHIRYWGRQDKTIATFGQGAKGIAQALDGEAVPATAAEAEEVLTSILTSKGVEVPKRSPNGMLKPGAPTALELAFSAMQNSISHPISIPALADCAGVSQRQLERLCQAHFGRSPNQVHRQIRLEEARRLLRTSSTSIAEISRATGFTSPVHFSRAYRAEFGMSPRQDRSAHRLAT